MAQFSYIAHVHRQNHQQESTKGRKNTLSESDLCILMDWSENYQCKYSNEPQTVHFGALKKMVSLHTGMISTKNFAQVFCTFSKSFSHDAVMAHLKPVISYVTQMFPQLKTIHFQSDGPSTQYRNKNIFWLMCNYFPKVFPQFQKIIYNYSEAGHGKEPADGVRGVMKRTFDDLVAFGEDMDNYETLVR